MNHNSIRLFQIRTFSEQRLEIQFMGVLNSKSNLRKKVLIKKENGCIE